MEGRPDEVGLELGSDKFNDGDPMPTPRRLSIAKKGVWFEWLAPVVVDMWCGSRRDLCVFQITGTHVGTVPKFTCGESYLPGVKMVQ